MAQITATTPKTAIPPVALGTNGHLPSIVAEAARQHPAGLLTEAQRTLTYDEGLGAYRTAPVETELRDVDAISSDAENAETSLFAAEAVVTDWMTLPPVKVDGQFVSGGQVEGRFTNVWFHYGTTTGEVSRAKAREIARTMRDFADRMEALCDRADEVACDDFEAPTEACA